jgi:hypothetical protein
LVNSHRSFGRPLRSCLANSRSQAHGFHKSLQRTKALYMLAASTTGGGPGSSGGEFEISIPATTPSVTVSCLVIDDDDYTACLLKLQLEHRDLNVS